MILASLLDGWPVLVGVVTALVFLFRGQAIFSFFTNSSRGATRAAVNSAAVDVVDLLRTEVGELRTQLADARKENAEYAKQVTKLQGELEILSRQISAEEELKRVNAKLDGLSSQVKEVLEIVSTS